MLVNNGLAKIAQDEFNELVEMTWLDSLTAVEYMTYQINQVADENTAYRFYTVLDSILHAMDYDSSFHMQDVYVNAEYAINHLTITHSLFYPKYSAYTYTEDEINFIITSLLKNDYDLSAVCDDIDNEIISNELKLQVMDTPKPSILKTVLSKVAIF